MITIGRIPKKLQHFSKPPKDHFTARVWEHFRTLLTAVTIRHSVTIDKITKALKGSTHEINQADYTFYDIPPGGVF